MNCIQRHDFRLSPTSTESPCTEGNRPTYLLGNSGEQLPRAVPNSCCWRARSLSLCVHQRPEVGHTDTQGDRKTANRGTYSCADTQLAGKPVQCLPRSAASRTPPPSLQNRKQPVQAAQNPTATEIKVPQTTAFQHAKSNSPKMLRVKVTRTLTDVRHHKHSKISDSISPCCTHMGFIILASHLTLITAFIS